MNRMFTSELLRHISLRLQRDFPADSPMPLSIGERLERLRQLEVIRSSDEGCAEAVSGNGMDACARAQGKDRRG